MATTAAYCLSGEQNRKFALVNDCRNFYGKKGTRLFFLSFTKLEVFKITLKQVPNVFYFHSLLQNLI
ncbi:hypothetical protein V5J35_003378 [Endozoicomonas sp. NE40]|uniref:Uncharacterized protein n=1 Tax=Endozoicomonas lisbonensis TaxID=3120522 RepID=A0ABV2SK87_9GAMM